MTSCLGELFTCSVLTTFTQMENPIVPEWPCDAYQQLCRIFLHGVVVDPLEQWELDSLSVRGGYSGFPVLKDKTRENRARATQALWLCWYSKWKDLNITDPKLCPHFDWGCPCSPDTSMLTPSHIWLTCQTWPFLSFSGPPWLETQGFHWGHQSLDGISWSPVNTVDFCLQFKAFKSARGFTNKSTLGF